MGQLRTSSFAILFSVTFVVAATFQVAMSLLSVLLAVLSPGLFQMNGEMATSPGQALGVLVFLLVIGLIINAGMAAVGSPLAYGKPGFANGGFAAMGG